MHHDPISRSALGAMFLAAVLALSTLFAVGADVRAQATPEAERDPVPGEEASFEDVDGNEVGTVTLTEDEDGVVTVSVTVDGLEPGDKGIHLHAMGICEPDLDQPFSSAGPHYNPTQGMHGGPPDDDELATPEGDPTVHAGDLGNITIEDDGTGTLEIETTRFTVSEGPTSIFDADGTSVIIHESADDLETDPTGLSGARIACAVIAPPVEMAEEMETPGAERELTVEGNILVPQQLPFSEELLEQIELPEGFEIAVFAEGLNQPRMMEFGPDGTLYVTSPDANQVIGVRDSDGDWVADETFTAASDLRLVHGILLHEGQMILAGEHDIWIADINDDGTFAEPETLIDDLPDGGQHPRRTIGIGPDGMLYISIGSTCNVCIEPNEEHAAMLRADLETGERELFASGLRNTIGFGWHPETGEFWGLDMGSDFRGDDQPPEELNLIEQDKHYGWPFCFGDQEADLYGPYKPVGATFEQFCANTEPPVLTYQAHASPIDFMFYEGDQFPEEYQGDGFAANRGSWNRIPAVGYEVIRVEFDNGEPVSIEPFVGSWLVEDGQAHFGRIAGLAVAEDGSLFVSDDTNGMIYRISYEG
jgi:glucose/arabinose dehydrogenase/Cu/Zn superoxide dismutase